LLPYKDSSTRIVDERLAKTGIVDMRRKALFNTPIPPFLMNVGYVSGVASASAVPAADYPNRMFASSMDLDTIKRNIMRLDQPCLDAEESGDQEVFMALSNDVISDLLDDEPDIYTSDDVKVRFR
jgi:hypothetical protein